jgi:threonylcarbamoyladenosine tRNA methylthiotransferase MtaB
MPSVSLYTLGCKLNQLESEAVADAFRAAECSVIPWNEDRAAVSPDILVVNTCTVTSMAEQKARRVIRKALRDHPFSCLVVTGCYAQLERETLEGLAAGDRERFFVVSGDAKDTLLDLPRFLAENAARTGEADLRRLVREWSRSPGSASGTPAPHAEKAPEQGGRETRESRETRFRFAPETFSFHSRSFLKIQDGCDRRCAFCRVSAARGPSVSLEAERVLSCLKAIEDRGIAEAVLTGVNICQYAGSGLNLGGLLEYLLRGTTSVRLRLSSLEPDAVTEDFAEVLRDSRIRSHFHLSVQSGSPVILKGMGRPYGPEEILAAAERLRSVKDDPFLACDIIAGFPGETGEEFEKTRKLCERLRFAWIHAFPFSRRPGTAAFSYGNRVSERDAAVRVKILASLARNGKKEYVKRWTGRETEAVVEEREKKSCFYGATSDNYLKLLLSGDFGGLQAGHSIRCRIAELPVAGDFSGFDAAASCL